MNDDVSISSCIASAEPRKEKAMNAWRRRQELGPFCLGFIMDLGFSAHQSAHVTYSFTIRGPENQRVELYSAQTGSNRRMTSERADQHLQRCFNAFFEA